MTQTRELPGPEGAHHEAITVAVRAPCSSSQLIESDLVDLYDCSATLRFHDLEASRFSLGEFLEIHFGSPELEQPLVAPSRVGLRTEAKEGRLYVLEFLDPLGLREMLPPPLLGLFNQRNSDRVPVPASSEIAIELCARDEESYTVCRLRDLSPGGMSLWIDPEAERFLQGIEDVKVCFRLPTSPETTIRLSCKLRHRQLDREGLWYGLSYRPGRKLQTQLGVIVTYLKELRGE